MTTHNGSNEYDSKQRPHRVGMTLVEVLVAIAIIGLLAAIVLPAVQSVRVTSRRMQCASNQRQLVIAMSSYHDSYSVYPPLRGWTAYDECPPETPISRLFPYIELGNLCDVLKTTVRRLPILECPADSDITLMATPLSYVVNASPGVGSGSYARGPFDSIEVVRAADITDGLSNTAGISENIAVRAEGTSTEATSTPVRYGWSVFVPPVSASVQSDPLSQASMAERASQADLSIQDCTHGPRTFVASHFSTGGQWGPGPFGGAWTYSHWYPPNSPLCGAESPGLDGNLFLLNNRRSASGHPGGVNVTFMDGHQRFVSNQIDQIVWRAAGTRNGNEVNGGLP